jgi:hypothetical protein
MCPEPVQFGIFFEIAFDIVQDARNVGEKLGIAFDAVDVDESPCRHEVTLDARQLELASEALSVGPHMQLPRQSVELTVDQAVDQRLVEFDIGVAQ